MGSPLKVGNCFDQQTGKLLNVCRDVDVRHTADMSAESILEKCPVQPALQMLIELLEDYSC